MTFEILDADYSQAYIIFNGVRELATSCLGLRSIYKVTINADQARI